MSRYIRPSMRAGAFSVCYLLFNYPSMAQEAALPHPIATVHLPFFITAPGQSDTLFTVVVIFLLATVLIIGNLYFQLHAMPERMAHRTSKVQMELVAVLALISLFTHNHAFWIAALLLAFIEFPDFSTPMSSIASSLEKLAGKREAPGFAPSLLPSTGLATTTYTEPSAMPAEVHKVHPDAPDMAFGLAPADISKKGN